MKNPFIVIDNFLSPLECESVINSLDFVPTFSEDGKVKANIMRNRLMDMRLSKKINDLVEDIETYYKCEIDSFSAGRYEWYPTNYQASNAECENSCLINGTWSRKNQNDFMITIILNDHQEKVPFDPDYEVKGGNLEYPTHNFSFLPKRGMVIIHPANQYFLHGIASVKAGNLYLIRICAICDAPYKYDPEQFKGSYNIWFK
jgi:hypothetical protein